MMLRFPQRSPTIVDMEHPNLARVRHHRSTSDLAEQSFHIVIVRALEERPNSGPSRYTADDVAKAAGLSRARVYQIRDAAKGTE
jgi:hypothetical protein